MSSTLQIATLSARALAVFLFYDSGGRTPSHLRMMKIANDHAYAYPRPRLRSDQAMSHLTFDHSYLTAASLSK